MRVQRSLNAILRMKQAELEQTDRQAEALTRILAVIKDQPSRAGLDGSDLIELSTLTAQLQNRREAQAGNFVKLLVNYKLISATRLVDYLIGQIDPKLLD